MRVDRGERKKYKIINRSATCTVTVAIVHKCTILHPLMWVFFCSNCLKSVTFSILHNFAHTDGDALRWASPCSIKQMSVVASIYDE